MPTLAPNPPQIRQPVTTPNVNRLLTRINRLNKNAKRRNTSPFTTIYIFYYTQTPVSLAISTRCTDSLSLPPKQYTNTNQTPYADAPTSAIARANLKRLRQRVTRLYIHTHTHTHVAIYINIVHRGRTIKIGFETALLAVSPLRRGWPHLPLYTRARVTQVRTSLLRAEVALYCAPRAGRVHLLVMRFRDFWLLVIDIYIRERACVIAVAVCIRVKKERAIEETREGVNNALGVMSRCGSGQRFNALRWFNLGIIA